MIARIAPWWRQRTPREQGLLLLLLLIAVPVIGFYGVVRPLDRAIEQAQEKRDADAHALADVLLMANRLGAPAAAKRGKLPIEAQLEDSAQRAGFTIAGVAREASGATVTIDAVRAQPFFAWIASLRQRDGLIVTRLDARPNGDATLAVAVHFERSR